MKFSTIARTFLLLSALEGRVVSGDESWGVWWDGIKDTFGNFTESVTTTAECSSDWYTMLDANPAVLTASNAYEATYGYTTTDNWDGSSQAQLETTSITYGAEALAAYGAACDAVITEPVGVWWEMESGTTFSCTYTADESYTFEITYENYGDCWPTTDACSDYATGLVAFGKSLGDEFGDDVTCTQSVAALPEPTGDDSSATPPSMPPSDAADDATPPSMPPSDATGDEAATDTTDPPAATEEEASPSEESSASTMTSGVVAAAAALATVVGTVMHL